MCIGSVTGYISWCNHKILHPLWHTGFKAAMKWTFVSSKYSLLTWSKDDWSNGRDTQVRREREEATSLGTGRDWNSRLSYNSQTIAGLPHSFASTGHCPQVPLESMLTQCCRGWWCGHFSCVVCCLAVSSMPRPQSNRQQAVNGDKDIMTADTGPHSYDITPLIWTVVFSFRVPLIHNDSLPAVFLLSTYLTSFVHSKCRV